MMLLMICNHHMATYCSYYLAANITAITWLLIEAIMYLPTWLILGQGALLQTTGSHFWHGLLTLILYLARNQTQIITAALTNDVATDLQLSGGYLYCSYHLAANIAAITWLLIEAITCLPTWFILGQDDLLQTTGSHF